MNTETLPVIGERSITVCAEVRNRPQLDGIVCELISTKHVDFTFELATKFLEMPDFAGEREIRPKWVEHLVGEAKDGQWRSELASLISAHCEWDGVIRRLNGQHTCWMRLNMPEDWTPKIEVIHYKVKTEEDFRRLYTVIDSGAVRTNAHKVAARLTGTKEMEGIDNAYIQRIAGAVRVLKDNRHMGANALADLISSDLNKLIRKSIAFMVEKKLLNGKDARHMRRSAVIAAIMATMHKSAADAETFWVGVGDGVGMSSKKDPRLKLRDYLLRASIKNHGVTLLSNVRVTDEEMYRACLLAWNRYREGLAGGEKELNHISVGSTARRPRVK